MMSSSSSAADFRRRLRDARPRPWLTNSVLRERGSSGATSALDAPKVVVVPSVASPESPSPVLAASEKKCEIRQGKLPRAVAKVATSVKAAARSAGSKIPIWVGLSCVFSRSSIQAPDSVEVVKMESAAVVPAATGELTRSRLPVSVKKSSGVRRVFGRDRRASLRNAFTRRSGTREQAAGKIGSVAGKSPPSLFAPFKKANKDTGDLSKAPASSHRSGSTPRSILAGKGESHVEIKALPETSSGYGVMSKPKKTVRWCAKIKTCTPPRPCKGPLSEANSCCGEFECRDCEDDRPEELSGSAWVEEQLALGYDYLKWSDGMLKGVRFSSADLTF